MPNMVNQFTPYFKEYITRGITGGAPWAHWNYKDDIIVLGLYDLYLATGDVGWKDAILQVTQGKLLPDDWVCGKNLDSVSAGKTDWVMHAITGEERFAARLRKCVQALESHPRTQSGNFWHKDLYPNQVWLDGLYMGLPIYLQNPHNAADALRQIETVHTIMYNPATGLYPHAWDESKTQEWCDKATGLSRQVWCRALGWFLMALCDCWEWMPQPAQKARLAALLQEAIEGILPYQDAKTKMFYQLVELAAEPANYPETSGSAMVAYALMKGARLGMLANKCWQTGAEVLEGIAATQLRHTECGTPLAGQPPVAQPNGRMVLYGICGSAGLGAGPDNRTDRDGTAAYYFSELQKPDNQHGAAACMMAYSEYLRQA